MTDAREAITTLLFSYAERLDAGDLEGVAQLFAHATLRTDGFEGERRGSAEVLELYRGMVALYDGKPCTKHVTTNVIIEVNEPQDAASARSYFSVLQARPELPLQVIIAGRYHDRFARVAGAWRFTDRLMFVDLLGDLRFHLKFNMAPA